MIETLTYVVSTLVTYGLGKLSKKKGWNETLPIPVQNIVVAVLVFFISALYIRLTNQEVVLSDILNQIFLSGWKTATGEPMPRPSYIVNSGTGLHLYFVLKKRSY